MCSVTPFYFDMCINERPDSTIIFCDFPLANDFPGLENEIIEFHDFHFPGFQRSIQTWF